jgi:hypothetical protein
MGFLIKVLINFLIKILAKFSFKKDRTNTNISINRLEKTNSIAEATAAILWVCAFFLVIQYGVETYFWIKGCILHNSVVKFSFSSQKLFEMIYSLSN